MSFCLNNRLVPKNRYSFMKKILPKSINNPEGFTLVELLVVISIIAILSIIGITVFTGVQKSSRDARRKGDIEAIAKALESDFATSNRTQYIVPVATMFAGGNVPVDPVGGGSSVYTTSTLPAATYTVCALLESGKGNSSDTAGTAAVNGNYFCRKNQQ